jgi:tRNA dimethylallyltransferase
MEKDQTQNLKLKKDKLVPCIVGPTCVGKTSLAMKIARELDAEILSIDSRQVIKGLDIGTGKLKGNADVLKGNGHWVVNGIVIHGYDLDQFTYGNSVLDFAEYAVNVIRKSEKKIIVTCGTGYYLNFLMGNIPYGSDRVFGSSPYEDDSLEELQEEYLRRKKELKDILDKDDRPIDMKNRRKLISRIDEIQFIIQYGDVAEPFDSRGIKFELYYLNNTRDYLYKKADEFVDYILEKNVMGEYLEADNEFFNPNTFALQGLLYLQVGQFLRQEISFEEMSQRMKFSLHAYIRRQQTYFKKFNFKLETFDPDEILASIIKSFHEYYS